MMRYHKKVSERDGVFVCAPSFIHLEKAAYMLAIKNKSLNLSADSSDFIQPKNASSAEPGE
jgi:hypothetical protein